MINLPVINRHTTTKPLIRVWGEQYWQEVAIAIEKAYYNILSTHINDVPAPCGEPTPTEHRLEAFVRLASREINSGITHLGLTSSDLEDNIRIVRLYESTKYIANRLLDTQYRLLTKIDKNNGRFIAYTHLLPAGVIYLVDRFAPTIDALYKSSLKRPIYLKGIRGALGDRKIQHYIGITDKELDDIFSNTFIEQQKHSSQTGDHLTEINTAQWLATNVALIAKIANDIRMMFAFGQAECNKKDIASTALVHKLTPNPWRWEKISGLSETLFTLPSTVYHILANCLLERTLTNQSSLSTLFREAFSTVDTILDNFDIALEQLRFIPNFKETEKLPEHLMSEFKLVDLVKGGLNREEAYSKLQQTFKN